MLLKKEKKERLGIKSDPRVQINVAASCSKYYFIGILLPFLWSAILNHALADKCTLVTFNLLCPGTENRTIIGLGCVWKKAPLLTTLCQWLLHAAHAMVPVCFLRRANSPAAAAAPSLTQSTHLSLPSTLTETTQPGEGELSHVSCSAGASQAAPVLPMELPHHHFCHGMALSSLSSHWLHALSLEGEKFEQLLPAARLSLYCLINTTNYWSRVMETSLKLKIKIFWSKWEKTVTFFAAAVCGVHTVTHSDALCT